MADALMPRGRGFSGRTHVYTAFHRYRFGLVRDPGPMKPHLALDAPYRGLLVEIVDAPSPAGLAGLEVIPRADPHECAPAQLGAHHGLLAASGRGTLRFSGSFVPTVVGTDRYVDDLR